MSLPKVLVTRRLPSSALDVLRAQCKVDLHDGQAALTREQLIDRIGKVDAAICLLTDIIDKDVLSKAYSVRAIATVSVGYNNIDIEECRRRSIMVTHTPDVLTEATADLTWSLILGATRRVVEGDRLVRRGGWKGFGFDFMLGRDLRGKRLGILGMGRIGQAVARRGLAFGMEVVYTPSPPKRRRQSPTRFPGFRARPLPLDELITTADIVAVHVPLTPETQHLINRKTLARMKRSAYLVNVSRGPVVDEAALAWALREGLIAGAALDVYEREPEVHAELLTLENVVLAPHLGSATVETRTAMAQLAVDNCVNVLYRRKPLTPVPELKGLPGF
jgi:glyoxylate reductase